MAFFFFWDLKHFPVGESAGFDPSANVSLCFEKLYPVCSGPVERSAVIISPTLFAAAPAYPVGRSLHDDARPIVSRSEELRLAFAPIKVSRDVTMGLPWPFTMIPYTEHAHGGSIT